MTQTHQYPRTARRLPGLLLAAGGLVLTGLAHGLAIDNTAAAHFHNALSAQQDDDQPAPDAEPGAEAPNPDNSADDLNARQNIRQTFTVKRKLDGQTIDEKTVEIPGDSAFATRASEARGSVRSYVRDKADREILTRPEAAQEARLEFALADANRDGIMTQTEYQTLAQIRTEDENYAFLIEEQHARNKAREPDRTDRYEAFREADRAEWHKLALAQHFRAMVATETLWGPSSGLATSGKISDTPSSGLTENAYVRAFMRDFDAADLNGDFILQETETRTFRRALYGDPDMDERGR